MAIIKDKQTVTPEGKRIIKTPIEGVKLKESVVQFDTRGSMCEIHTGSWNFLDVPINHVYFLTIRPKQIKGWVEHHVQSDRLMVIKGEARLALFDGRKDSPTYKALNFHWLSERKPTLVLIPPYVWHAVQNVGNDDAFFINLPTHPYNHENPDKYRLPLKNDFIPFEFEDYGNYYHPDA